VFWFRSQRTTYLNACYAIRNATSGRKEEKGIMLDLVHLCDVQNISSESLPRLGKATHRFELALLYMYKSACPKVVW
jgi:hypothetical protein